MSEPFDPITLIDALLDGDITPDDHARLDAWLAADPANAAVLVARTRLHRNLHASVSTGARRATPNPSLTQAASAGRTQRFRITLTAWSIAAALLLTAAAVTIYVFTTNPESPTPNPLSPPIATLIESTGTVIANEGIAHEGGEYAAGTYSIESGTAEFLLDSRVTVNLRGRTRLTLHGRMAASIEHGTATFNCPPGAEGYTVHLPCGIRVVDLGTAFEVTTDGAERSLVRVTEGRVRIDDPDGRSWRVAAGGAMTFTTTPTEIVATREQPLLSESFERADAVVIRPGAQSFENPVTVGGGVNRGGFTAKIVPSLNDVGPAEGNGGRFIALGFGGAVRSMLEFRIAEPNELADGQTIDVELDYASIYSDDIDETFDVRIIGGGAHTDNVIADGPIGSWNTHAFSFVVSDASQATVLRIVLTRPESDDEDLALDGLRVSARLDAVESPSQVEAGERAVREPGELNILQEGN